MPPPLCLGPDKRRCGRPDLVLPAILIGSLGTAVGTYLGFLTVDGLS